VKRRSSASGSARPPPNGPRWRGRRRSTPSRAPSATGRRERPTPSGRRSSVRLRPRLGAHPRFHLGHPLPQRVAVGARAQEAVGQPARVRGEPQLLLVLRAVRGRPVLRVEGVVAAHVVEQRHHSLRVAALHRAGGRRGRARAGGPEEQGGRPHLENEFHFQLEATPSSRAASNRRGTGGGPLTRALCPRGRGTEGCAGERPSAQ